MPISEVLERVDGRELDQWAAYEIVTGPLGPTRNDYLAAMLATVMANLNSKKKHRLDDFLISWDPDPNRGVTLSPEEMAAKLNTVMMALGGRMAGNGDDAS